MAQNEWTPTEDDLELAEQVLAWLEDFYEEDDQAASKLFHDARIAMPDIEDIEEEDEEDEEEDEDEEDEEE